MHPVGMQPTSEDVTFTGNVLADLLLRNLESSGKQTTDDTLRSLTGTEVGAVDVAGHLLGSLFAVLISGTVVCSARSKSILRVTHYLFGEALQLFTVDKAE